MKAARYYGPLDVRIEEIIRPTPGPDEILIRTQMVALCGTDASQYSSATMIPLNHPHPVSGRQAPITLGHEIVGTIIEMGSRVKGLRVGQRIVPGAGWWCGKCEQCRAGRSNICQDYYLHGIHADGGLAEFACFPAKMCVPVPSLCQTEAAAMGQACAVALHALDQASIGPGETVALFGVGGIGSLILAVWDAYWESYWEDFHVGPCGPIAVDIDARRLASAADLGVTLRVNASCYDPVQALRDMTGGQGVDVAIDATGNPSSILQALSATRRGGKLLQIGIPDSPVPLPLSELVVAEKTLLTTNGQVCERDLPSALNLLTKTDLAQRIDYQVIPFANLVEQGLRPLAEHRAHAKILVQMPREVRG